MQNQGYLAPAPAGQINRHTATADVASTAAQDALATVEQCKEHLLRLGGRIGDLANRLGVPEPPSGNTDKAVPRVARGGIIGSIHLAAEDIGSALEYLHGVMNRIERQV